MSAIGFFRHCPFCKSDNVKLMLSKRPCGTNGLNDIVYRYKAYVRCLNCNARGPLASGRVMYVSYDLPSWARDPWVINEEAQNRWNAMWGKGDSK